MEWLFSLAEIDLVAREFLSRIPPARVLAFYGGLGAGKTTFIKALCRCMGVREVTSSPTFSLVNDYVYPGTAGEDQHILHLDLYRIRDEEEAIQAGIEDCLYQGALCLVEWPEKIPLLLPEDTLQVRLTLAGDQRRLVFECPPRAGFSK